MQSNTLLSTARTSRQQTSTSTGPLSDRELRVWDLLRSGHELGHGEPPDSWAKKKAVFLGLCPLLDSTSFANQLYTSINQYSYLFWSPLDAKSRPGCRTRQRCRGWAPSGWCPPHPAKPAWCCRRTNSPLHPALLSAGPPTDGISDNPRVTGDTELARSTLIAKITSGLILIRRTSPLLYQWAAAFLCDLTGLNILELMSAAPNTAKERIYTIHEEGTGWKGEET